MLAALSTIAWFAVIFLNPSPRLSWPRLRTYSFAHPPVIERVDILASTSRVDDDSPTLTPLYANQLTIEWLRDGLGQRH